MDWYGRDPDRKFEAKIDFITMDSVDSLVLEERPDFLEYLYFHNVLDKFCWLLKFQYADRDTVRRKKYRLDTLFQRFLLDINFTPEKASKCISSKASEEDIRYHLQKGWLNELVRSVPLHPDYLEIGTMLSRWAGPGSEGTASWNIIQSYYAFYEFMCCICTTVDSAIDARGHKNVAKAFSNKIIGMANKRVVFYPYNLTSKTPPSYIPEHPKHCQYHYATYPRERGRGIEDLEDEMQKAFKVLDSSGRRSIFDLLYEFRLWANYTGVHALMKLSDGATRNS